jgi:hypothetical protein
VDGSTSSLKPSSAWTPSTLPSSFTANTTRGGAAGSVAPGMERPTQPLVDGYWSRALQCHRVYHEAFESSTKAQTSILKLSGFHLKVMPR